MSTVWHKFDRLAQMSLMHLVQSSCCSRGDGHVTSAPASQVSQQPSNSWSKPTSCMFLMRDLMTQTAHSTTLLGLISDPDQPPAATVAQLRHRYVMWAALQVKYRCLQPTLITSLF